MTCRYTGDRGAALMGLLYDEIDPTERATFEAHVVTCARCRAELDALRGVRDQLAGWTPPYPAQLLSRDAASRAAGRRWALLRDLPAWAQVAAAVLVVGVAGSVANLTVRWDGEGLTMRTGWMVRESAAAAIAPTGSRTPAPWTGDLAALERQLRDEMRVREPAPQAAVAQAAPGAAPDAALMRRLRVMVDESERKQQRELALRLAEIVRDLDMQRRADLVKIDRNLGLIQNNTGAEVLRQRELLNYLVRVSQKQ